MHDDIAPEHWRHIEDRVMEIARACYAAGIADATGVGGADSLDPPLAVIVAETRRRYREQLAIRVKAALPGWFREPDRRLP